VPSIETEMGILELEIGIPEIGILELGIGRMRIIF
jgi:hypothetical protein